MAGRHSTTRVNEHSIARHKPLVANHAAGSAPRLQHEQQPRFWKCQSSTENTGTHHLKASAMANSCCSDGTGQVQHVHSFLIEQLIEAAR